MRLFFWDACGLKVVVLVLLLCGTGMASRPSIDVPTPQSLWELVGEPSIPDAMRTTRQPWLIREQTIHFHQASLRTLGDIGAPLQENLLVELIGNTRELVVQSRTAGALNSTIVQGILRGGTDGNVTLVIKNMVVTGTIHLGTRVMKIEYLGDGTHRLAELDPEKFPPD